MLEAREKIVEVLCSWYEHCNTRKQYGCFTKREHWELCRYIVFADAILALKEIAVVDRSAELPENYYSKIGTGRERHIGFGREQESMLKEGWVKEVKDE